MEHLDWVNFDQINNVGMEELSLMKDNVVLDGDDLHGSSAIIGWGLGFARSYFI